MRKGERRERIMKEKEKRRKGKKKRMKKSKKKVIRKWESWERIVRERVTWKEIKGKEEREGGGGGGGWEKKMKEVRKRIERRRNECRLVGVREERKIRQRRWKQKSIIKKEGVEERKDDTGEMRGNVKDEERKKGRGKRKIRKQAM